MDLSFVNSTFDPREIMPTLPDPFESSDPDLTNELNRIMVLSDQTTKGTPRARSSKSNNSYDPELKAKIAKDAIAYGSATKAAKKWSASTGKTISESTVRNWVKKFKALDRGDPVELIPDEKRGRPTKLPTVVREKVLQRIQLLSNRGSHIDYKKTIGIGRTILSKLRPELARTIKLGRSWAESIMAQLKFVKRKVTKSQIAWLSTSTRQAC